MTVIGLKLSCSATKTVCLASLRRSADKYPSLKSQTDKLRSGLVSGVVEYLENPIAAAEYSPNHAGTNAGKPNVATGKTVRLEIWGER